jgi:SAM-dependent methyltransferase
LNAGSPPGEHRAALYGEDLSHVHHVGFGGYSRAAAPGLLRILRAAGIRCGRVVDLACGSGIWARELASAGYEVLGVDSSAAMIARAREVAPRARFVRASIHDFALPACEAVTAIGEGLCYLDSDTGTRPSLDTLFRKIARALPPGGLFVFDALLGARGKPMAYRPWRSGRDFAVMTDVTEDRRRRLVRRDITTFRRVGPGWRRSDETHWLRVLDRAALERELRRAGFSVRVSDRIGSFVLPPRRLAFVARRRP